MLVDSKGQIPYRYREGKALAIWIGTTLQPYGFARQQRCGNGLPYLLWRLWPQTFRRAKRHSQHRQTRKYHSQIGQSLN